MAKYVTGHQAFYQNFLILLLMDHLELPLVDKIESVVATDLPVNGLPTLNVLLLQGMKEDPPVFG